MKRRRLSLLFGGRSCEHEVSVISARSLFAAVDPRRYETNLIGIDKGGRWHLAADFDSLLRDGIVAPRRGDSRVTEVALAMHRGGGVRPLHSLPREAAAPPLPEVIFPVLHGTFGEDGTVQGALELAGIPYIGCGVAASAVAMDKALAKKVFAAAALPQTPHAVVTADHWRRAATAVSGRVEDHLRYPLFIKPANLGSSVGIRKAHGRAALRRAVAHALRYDHKVVIEQSVEDSLEVECAVLGHHTARASVVGEIIPGAEFYDYATKYQADTAELVVPARLPAAVARRVRRLALAAFRELGACGLARVDFFVRRGSGEVLLNEVNTMPGFTPISMYPRLWAASGVPYRELIHRLIRIALARHGEDAALVHTVRARAPAR